MEWQPEAREKINRIPAFIRRRAVKMVEEEARRLGLARVTLEHLENCRQKMLAGNAAAGQQENFTGYSVETCMGREHCPHNLIDDYDSLVATLEELLAGRNLAAFFRRRVKGPLKFHHRFSVVIAGCPNACSRPQIADLGLIGVREPRLEAAIACDGCGACAAACPDAAIRLDAGTTGAPPVIEGAKCLLCGQCISACPTGTITTGREGLRLLAGGKLGRHPRLAATLPGIHDRETASKLAGRCLDLFQQHNQDGERFGTILDRLGPAALEAIGSCRPAGKKAEKKFLS